MKAVVAPIVLVVVAAWLAPSADSSTLALRSSTETFVRPVAASALDEVDSPETALSGAAPSSLAADSVAVPSRSSADSRPPRLVRVVLWGDSLAAEASASFDAALAGRDDVLGSEVTWPGTALCDALPSIAAMSAERTVDVAVIEFSGNAYTECMIDPATGQGFAGNALVERYEADVTEAIELLGNAGATVILAGAPPVLPDGQWAERARVVELYRNVATRYDHVRFVDAGAVLSLDRDFTYTLPCLDFEGASHGCVDGRIRVRSDDGLHVGLGDSDVWSSGSYRYGLALAMAALAGTDR